ncbi:MULTISPECIES: hypothetical protein [unclassified Haladaptatus]|uniref:hypothetical protein n=1 Tax=unclassified Haladaptatus TaxID=2622732 RepID=UPI00209C34E7|nr:MULTISPECIES: hypothetical protein [unclassified Haladaptatus]MCO8245468.1 hypothetical protein [Haladaptatus sp. AB643]MCO8256580.1 hypothetical protein [Haladaptatus sp. AB618]
MKEQNDPEQTNEQETLDQTLDALLATEEAASTTSDIANIVQESPETTRSTLTELHNQGRIERLEIHDTGVLWWAPRPLDGVLKSTGAETILKRLSDELATSITLGDGTVYEDGDKHSPSELNQETESRNELHSSKNDSGGLVPSSKESGEKRRELKEGADFEDVSE